MTTEDAWQIYDAQKGKNGRPKKEFVEAEALLIKSGELTFDAPTGNTESKKSEDKKPALAMKLIEISMLTYRDIEDMYKAGLSYITDKRNFSFRHYLIGEYGVTKSDLDKWESEFADIKRLATIAHDYIEYKLVDALNDKWSGGNPIGNMMTLKAEYGYNDRGDSGALKAEGVIEISSEIDSSDMGGSNDYLDIGGDDE